MRISALAVLAFAAALSAADGVPLGHPDFYPTPNRPLGWRGDGTGAWPGANCVATWNAETGENIVWKTETPGAGLCQPIVVGEKVFVTADPNLLLCYSVHDGKLLWQTAIDHTLCMNEADRTTAREDQKFFDGKWKEYCEWREAGKKLEDGILKISGSGPPPDRKKDKNAFAQWEQSRNAALKDLYPNPANDRRLVEPKDPGYAIIQKLVKDDTEVKNLFEHVVATQQTNCWRSFQGSGNGWMIHLDKGRGGEPPPAYAKRYQESQMKYDTWYTAAAQWIGYMTYSFATPITDGKYIYVTTANNAVAAVDLNGRIAWIIWEHRPNRAGNLGTQYGHSPAVLDGKLVVTNMGLLRVYDTTNGKKLWEVWGPAEVAKTGKPCRANYFWRGCTAEVGSPLAGHLPLPDGGRLAFTSDGGHRLWRLEDGKLLCSDMGIAYTACGCSDILKGDLYAWVTGGDGAQCEWKGVSRLKAESKDKVTVEPVWKTAKGCHSTTPVLWDGKFYAHGECISDVLTGEQVGSFKGMRFSSNSPIIAGARIYSFTGCENNRESRSCVAAVTGGAVSLVSSAYIDNRNKEDSEFGLINRYSGGEYMQNSSPSAQANRMFFRSRGMLWCIGDPKQPFPAPKGCPAEARIGK
jgi:outer membrane protein assembly factor BamB